MTLGVIARCDTGGLAALTREVHRHLHPERTLLLDLEEHGRGACTPDDYIEGNTYRTTYKGGLSQMAIEWVTAEGIDTLWTAETWYDDESRQPLMRGAHGNGIRTIVYAMPELAPWATGVARSGELFPRTIHVPTWWRLDTIPNAQLLPFPVARDRLPYTGRKRLEHLYHPAGVAMLDRGGTQILLDALPFLVTTDLRLTIRSDRPVVVPEGTRIEVTVQGSQSIDYWDSCPTDADVLVLPRRYGGLSLPAQECASRGMPAIMLASDPYAQAPFVTTIPSTGSNLSNMKGGLVPVHGADPRTLAAAIDFLVEHPGEVERSSRSADEWAAEHDWEGPLGVKWAQLLGAER